MRTIPKVTSIWLSELVYQLRPGDIVSVQNGERGMLNFLIGQVQQHLLTDQNPNIPPEYRLSKPAIKAYSKFSHAMIVILPESDVGDCAMAENYYPHCTYINLSKKIGKGAVITVSRPKYVTTDEGVDKILNAVVKDVKKATPYPIRKLFWYFGYSWGWQKTILGRPLMGIFKYGMPGKKDDEWQVCSGSCWKWALAGMTDAEMHLEHPNDKFPESWYPARIASDMVYFDHIGTFKLL